MKANKFPKLAKGRPVVSCFALSKEELVARQDAAHARAEQLAQKEGVNSYDLGRFLLWHVECPFGLKATICDEELFRLTAFLPETLQEMNGGQPLDFFDYGYVADVVREYLAESSCLPGDAQNLRRALAWAEQQGEEARSRAHRA